MIMRETAPVEVGGVMLYNHLILAAGVLGTTGASLQRMLSLVQALLSPNLSVLSRYQGITDHALFHWTEGC